ncbi:hypothetical protein AK812_SmicGene24926 [Symbiodinium microadriaticum]|uniref:Uncharacterized protein n=1 Tax=Symbiodinium microadriaticum TaxID=2951 RepID=A0A1Q9DD99_SYMMI|nr:hypothetical protein AK812_SmicGene24926 [Symbiodinium microadriaticum]
MAKSIEESGRSKSVVKDEDGPLDGLDQWLESLGLTSRKADVVAWCKEQGACFLEVFPHKAGPQGLMSLRTLSSSGSSPSRGSGNVHHVASENILSKRSNSICPPVLTIPAVRHSITL